jgi:zinc/manganese transport system substrate-binding protein
MKDIHTRAGRLVLVASLVVTLHPAHASAALKVVTTIEGLGALVREVGGDRVDVESLSRSIQDPHFVDPNPTLAVKLRHADLLVDVGLELEVGWLPPLVNQSRNSDIQPGGLRRLTAANAVSVLEVPMGPVDRSQGDVHAAGNHHFLADPRRAFAVAEAIGAKLTELDRAGATAYQARLANFRARLDADQARWLAILAPLRGQRVVTQHKSLSYFFDWSGLVPAGYLEPKPGVPPSPSHLAEIVEMVRHENVKAIVIEGYYDTKPAEVVAKLTGAKVVVIPGDVGWPLQAQTYPSYIDVLVERVAEALR